MTAFFQDGDNEEELFSLENIFDNLIQEIKESKTMTSSAHLSNSGAVTTTACTDPVSSQSASDGASTRPVAQSPSASAMPVNRVNSASSSTTDINVELSVFDSR